ncbi:MAG TPA: NADH-quinone oxidoreductase subunit N [Geobacteraceae bacterium]|nr:NADH-quinone oxidoreductase subunit N [Geobacteraceae bacterium]
MTTADIWAFMPLLIIAVGILVVLLAGAFIPGRHGTFVGIAAAVGSACWAFQKPPQAIAPVLGIAFTPFARFFIVLFSLAAAVTLLLSHDFNDRRQIRGEEYPAAVLFAAFGMVVLSTATNLLNLFLGLEGLTFAFYILTAIDTNSPESGEAGLKYLLQGAVSAAFIAFGIALLYAGVGTLDIAPAMKAVTAGGKSVPLAWAGWGMLLTGLAFKVSLVPAHLWTPDVYQGAPTPVVAFLSTGSKAAGFATFLLLLPALGTGMAPLRMPLWWLSLLSMVLGNLAALRQRNLKRMLAYSSIAQMGYMTLALLTGIREGFAAVILYAVIYTVMNLTAFGAISSFSGEKRMDEIEDYRGFGYTRPLQGAVLALAMFALAGIPPTAGFMGKFAIFSAAIRGGEISLAVIGIITAVISVYYYLRVVVALYMNGPDAETEAGKTSLTELTALCSTAFVILLLGVYPGPLMDLIDSVLR